jgi:acyl-CoA dehydrogenase
VALAVLGGNLKRRELLSARLGDIHSQLFIACSILKYHSAHSRTRAEDAHAEFALTVALNKAQEALIDFSNNFPVGWVAKLIKFITLPYGKIVHKPHDDLVRELGDLIMEDNPVRQKFAQYLYVSHDPLDSAGRVESTYQMLLALGPLWSTWLKNQNKLAGVTIEEKLQDAVSKNIIQPQDVSRILEYDARRFDCILTDAFDKL